MSRIIYANVRNSVRVHIFEEPKQAAQFVGDEVVEFVSRGGSTANKALGTSSSGPTGKSALCLATGDSPKDVYDELARRSATGALDARGLFIIKLDEWYRMSMTDPSSCDFFLQERVIRPLGIEPESYLSFNGNAADPEAECARIDRKLDSIDGIGMSILGIGKNGHVGLNEPGASLEPRAHCVEIREATKTHSMIAGRTVERGLTIGLRDLLASQRIVLLLSGSGKEKAIEAFFSGRITLDLPASLLLLHHDIDIVCSASAVARALGAIETLMRRL